MGNWRDASNEAYINEQVTKREVKVLSSDDDNDENG